MFLCKLSDLYQLGHVDKKRKISADRALRILIEELIYDDWEQQVVISVPRIKAFFSLSPAKQNNAAGISCDHNEIVHYKKLVHDIEEEEINNECIINDDSLQDID